MVSYSKPAKTYVSMLFFWLSTSQLPWVTFAASSNPHFGQKTKLSCSCCPHVEQNIASKEEGGAQPFLFLCQHLVFWGECVAKISKCVVKISEFVVSLKCVSRNLECVVHNLKCVLNNSKYVVR